jgi:histone H3/H4
MADILVVQSKVKQAAKDSGMRMSSDAVDALSGLVNDAIKKAADRAKANKRQTIKASDV